MLAMEKGLHENPNFDDSEAGAQSYLILLQHCFSYLFRLRLTLKRSDCKRNRLNSCQDHNSTLTISVQSAFWEDRAGSVICDYVIYQN